MKKILFLTTLLGFSAASQADLRVEFNNVNNLNNNTNGSHNSRVYVCTLQPFTDVFADVGMSEDIARYKVHQRCEQSQGENSIFCKAKEAKCIKSSLAFDSDSGRHDAIALYSHKNHRGQSITISHDVPNLNVYNFDDRMSSYYIPTGWTVRFYEGTNYSGGYYTRKGGDENATGFNNKISSIKILSTRSW